MAGFLFFIWNRYRDAFILSPFSDGQPSFFLKHQKETKKCSPYNGATML